MKPHSKSRTLLTTLILFLLTATPTLATPLSTPTTNSKAINEMCVVGKSVANGMPTTVAQCLLYHLPSGTVRPNFKRLEVVGYSEGPVGILLDQSRVVDATDSNVEVRGLGRTSNGNKEEIKFQPSNYTAAYTSCALILYQDAQNGGDSVCFNPTTSPYIVQDLAWVLTYGSPGGWADRASAYETARASGAYYPNQVNMCIDPLQYGPYCNQVPMIVDGGNHYPWALDWIDAWGGPAYAPYTWNDSISGIVIYQ